MRVIYNHRHLQEPTQRAGSFVLLQGSMIMAVTGVVDRFLTKLPIGLPVFDGTNLNVYKHTWLKVNDNK